jgi:membrane-bound lytic murein transglycosylase B
VQRGARVNGEIPLELLAPNALPRNTLEELRLAGVEPRGAPLPGETRVTLLKLETPERPADYRIGLHNLYVLTRYNRSLFYAFSVADLAEALRAGRRAPAPR